MRYGISTLSIIPVRNIPTDKAEMVNQILFGEHFKIIESKKEWSKILLAHDNYEGWICNNQLVEIQKKEYNRIDKEISTITTDILDIITKDHHQPIIIGSVLPLNKDGHILINNELYKFDGNKTQGFTTKEKLIENAYIYLNTPYLWGGRTPFGIDCSGFVQIVYRLQGKRLPRDTNQQVEKGKKVDIVESEIGDLAFFDNEDGVIIHVGIIIDNNKIIHASGKVRIDKLDKKGIYNSFKKIYSHNLHSIKRIF